MQIDDLLKHLNPAGPMGMTELASFLKVTRAAVYQWRDGGIPPMRQLQIEHATAGRLRAGPECDRYRVPHLDSPTTTPGALDEQEAA